MNVRFYVMTRKAFATKSIQLYSMRGMSKLLVTIGSSTSLRKLNVLSLP